MSAAWHKLPFEVLTYIFEHNLDYEQYVPQSRKDLYNYQLVCKGWRKAAQSLLYRHISCQDVDIEDELQRFVQFVYTIKVLAPHTGLLVKTMTVCDRLDRLEAPLTALDAIFNTCPKLEEFFCNGLSKEVAWPYLLTLPDAKLSNIRSIVNDKDSRDYSPVYPFLAFKLKKSLSQLHFVEIHPDTPWHSRYLLDNLSQFASLQELSLLRCRFDSYSQLFEMIDRCSPTLYKLSIRRFLTFSSTESASISPNYTVKELSISQGAMGSIDYLAAKFKNLQKLTLNQVVPMHVNPAWILGLTEWCCSLPKYKLSFNLASEGFIKDWCIDLTKRPSSKDTFLVIDYSGENQDDPFAAEDDNFDPSWGITLRKEGARSGIEITLPWVERPGEEDSEFEYHTLWFDDYSPNQITMKHVEAINVMNSREFDHFIMATTPDEFTANFIHASRDEGIEAKGWIVLTRSLFSTVDTTDAIVSFSEMIIPNFCGRTKHLEESSSSPNVKQLTFTNCILYYQVLSVVSSWVPKLDTLIVDTCFILNEEPYTLRINLPETKLRHLKIVAGSLPFANSLPHTATVAISQLENVDLVRALSPEHQYTLKIEANGVLSTNTFRNSIKSPITYHDEAKCYGTSDNFLIWIQCKELEDVSIVNGTNSKEIMHRVIAP